MMVMGKKFDREMKWGKTLPSLSRCPSKAKLLSFCSEFVPILSSVNFAFLLAFGIVSLKYILVVLNRY